jgi:hypothetical protein
MAAYENALAVGEVATVDAIVAAAFNLEAEIEASSALIRRYLQAEAGRALSAMQYQYGIGADVTIDADFIRELLQSQESRFARDVSDTTVRGIRDQIAEGIANGEAHYQLRDRVLGFYGKEKEWRAGLAAQYESGVAYEGIRAALAARQGMNLHSWHHMGDEKVCDICRGNSTVGWLPIGQAFPSGHLHPLAHPGGCRCWCEYSTE